MVWVVEFFDTKTKEFLQGTGVTFGSFIQAKDEVKANFPDYTIQYTTDGPWQVTTPMLNGMPEEYGISTVSARIRNFPNAESYEFYQQTRRLIPGIENYVSDQIERFETVGDIQKALANIIAEYAKVKDANRDLLEDLTEVLPR